MMIINADLPIHIIGIYNYTAMAETEETKTFYDTLQKLYDTCAWTPNKRHLELKNAYCQQALRAKRLLTIWVPGPGLGKSRQVGHDSRS